MSEDQSNQSGQSPEERAARAALYAANQPLFDTRFDEIMVKLFVGFERSKFDVLERNDSVSEDGHA